MLSGYRALDLTDRKGFLCGKILGDLGVDVIKVEKPAGDPFRKKGPFYHDTDDPEKNLHWFALNANKRGITLDIEKPEGQKIFKNLSDSVDFVIESFSPGYMGNLGLGYSDLSSRNPRLIMASITPFGQTGPYKDYKSSDITVQAMSGIMYLNGDPDRAPLRLYLDQSYNLACSQAVVGMLLALQRRYSSGEGQCVDVSIFEVMVRANYRQTFMWEWLNRKAHRMGNFMDRGGGAYRHLWPCRDGYVSWMLMPENAKMLKKWIEWMRKEGQASRWTDMNWDEITGIEDWNSEDIGALEQTITDFILTHTMKELESASIEKGLLLSPVNPVNVVAEEEQLQSRNFWKKIEHQELGDAITYPRFSYLSTEGENQIRFRAPLIGEHNETIYCEELGISKDTLLALREQGVI